MIDPTDQPLPDRTPDPTGDFDPIADLPSAWVEASYLPARHPDRRRTEAAARAQGHDALEAFLAACAENDALRDATGAVAFPRSLEAALLNIPNVADTQLKISIEPHSARTPAPPTPSRLHSIRRYAIAACFLLGCLSFLAYQLSGDDIPTAPPPPEGVMRLATALSTPGPANPASKGTVATNSDSPEEATRVLAARFDRFTPEVLAPAAGYTLKASGITQVAGHAAIFASYHNDEKAVYTVYQLATADLGRDDTGYVAYETCTENRVRIWPNAAMKCTWALVSGKDNPVFLSSY